MEVGQDEIALINMRERGTEGNLYNTHIASKHQGLMPCSHTRLHIETHTLQALIFSPRGDASGASIKAHDAIIGTDIERLVSCADDALQAVIGEGAIGLFVAAVVVFLFVENKQTMMVSTDVYRAVGILKDGVHPEALHGKFYAALRVGALLVAEEAILGANP